MLEKGLKGSYRLTAVEENSAAAMGSGDLPVFATPAMVAAMEYAARTSVAQQLEEGCTTVGTLMNIKHVSATPIGMEVTAVSELIEVDRKRLVFSVKAFDEQGLIGEGVHERFIVKSEPFVEKANSKLSGK